MATQTQIVSVQLADGTTVKIKASVLGGYQDVVAFDKIFSFEDVANTIGSVAGSIMAILRKAQPDKASVEFGVELGIESGALTAFLVQGTGTANLHITLEWEKEKLVSG